MNNWTLTPGSSEAHGVATLWWAMFGVAAAVWIAVVIATIIAARRGRARRSEITTDVPYLGGETPVVHRMIIIATGLTVGILFFFMAYDLALGRQTPQHHDMDGLQVTVESRQFWWNFIYNDTVPGQRFASPNELHVPIKTRVNLILRSIDVIHSMWAPNLGGKEDLVPGYRGSLVFTVDTPGVYTGICAEFCGAQHAHMRFLVIAHTQQDYESWKAGVRAPSLPPTDSTLVAGQRAFLSGSCSTCHTIAGTPAAATNGPDLTHVASRKWLAAGTIPNTHDDMLRWIYNPQAIKPGTQMPALNLPPQTLEPLVAYLRTLK
jgi:cytochrome c oxidase subunit 2